MRTAGRVVGVGRPKMKGKSMGRTPVSVGSELKDTDKSREDMVTLDLSEK